MYKGLTLIFGFYFAGELIGELLNLHIPGSVIGMILLVFALISGLVDVDDVEKEAGLFIENMSIMFIPPGVGIILYLGLLKTELIPIFGALLLSFLITIVFTGKIVEVLR